MAKIENDSEKATGQPRHIFKVLISFDSLDAGATFPQVPDHWTRHGMAMGYLSDEGEEMPDAAQGAEGQR